MSEKVTSAPSAATSGTSGIAVGTEGVDLSALDELNKPSGKHVNDAVTTDLQSKLLTDSAFATLWNGNPETGTAGINPGSQTNTGNLIAGFMSPEYAEGQKEAFAATQAKWDDYSQLGQTITDPNTGEEVTVDFDYIEANSQSATSIYSQVATATDTAGALDETYKAFIEQSMNTDVVEDVPLEEYYDGTEKTA